MFHSFRRCRSWLFLRVMRARKSVPVPAAARSGGVSCVAVGVRLTVGVKAGATVGITVGVSEGAAVTVAAGAAVGVPVSVGVGVGPLPLA